MSEMFQCPGCGYENDETRVFCHNCGVRLPRTEKQIEEKAEQNRKATEEAKKVLREGVKKSVGFNLNELMATVVHALITVGFYAAFVAVIILALRVPAGLPAPSAPNDNLVKAGERQLLKASEPGYKGSIGTTQVQLNEYLAAKEILQSREDLKFLKAKVHRLFVTLEQSEFSFGMEYQLLGLGIVLQTTFRVAGQPGDFTLDVAGGAIGRLPLHPFLFEKVLRWYQPAADALHEQLRILSQAESISIAPEEVKVSWNRPSAPPPPPVPLGESSLSVPSLQ